MLGTRLRALTIAYVFLASAMHAESSFEIPLQVEPLQEIRAVTLKAAGDPYSCPVRNGVLLVPKSLPLPWTVALLRFEPTLYTQGDLERKTPLLLRELGELHVRFQPPARTQNVHGYFLRGVETTAIEASLGAGDVNTFRTTLPAGIYAAAFLGDGRATRIRSGIIIQPGKTTEIGPLALEPTGSVTLRVVDLQSRRPISGAIVTWSPPDALNADVAQVLFKRLWSGTTGRDGTITFPSVGPPPLPAQWSVHASGYTAMRTPETVIAQTSRAVLPDLLLRPKTYLIVDAQLPRPMDAFRDATLLLSIPEDDQSAHFRVASRQPLREGENKVRLPQFGRLRFSIESMRGKKLYYHDVDLDSSDRRLVIAPLPTDISGAVRRSGKGVEGVVVIAADPHEARMILGRAQTDLSGRYSLSVFQAGDILLYTNGPHQNGNVVQPVLKNLKLAGERERRVDFELPTAGATIVVVDAESRRPLKARVQGQLAEQTTGRIRSFFAETDEQGRARIVGLPEGKATLFVRSNGYRGQEITAETQSDPAELTVAMIKGGVISGRVFDLQGQPIQGARILGGYKTPLAPQPYLGATTDSSGRFEILEAAEPGRAFYVVARGHAITAATLREGTDNVIRLFPPNANAVTLAVDGARPATLSLFLPAPRGGEIIPFDVFRELGELNGMSPFQLLSSGSDGTLVLPEFLAPGNYTLYVVRSTGPNQDQYVKAADLRVPAAPNAVIAFPD